MNEFSKKSLKSLALFILSGLIIASAIITLSDCNAGGNVSIWNIIAALSSVLAIVLGLHRYLPKK